MASNLQDLIKLTCTAADPWQSKNDLPAGTLWAYELMKQLQSTYFGIVCVNRSNLNSPWLHFEAGALAKSLDSSAVFPYLIDCSPSSVSGPLSLFQAVSADKDGTFKLLSALNNTLKAQSEPCQSEIGLRTLFDKLWPDYKQKLDQAPQVPIDAGPERSNSDVLSEILSKTRMHSRLLVSILRSNGSFVPPIRSTDPVAQTASEEDYVSVTFEELRSEAMNLRKAGRFATAFETFQKALGVEPEDLETQIDLAVTKTYIPKSVYQESIQILAELVRESAMEQASHQESIIAKAYYNLACIKHIARRDQNRQCSDDEIFGDMEEAFRRYPAYVDTALADPDLLELRDYPRFKELVERYRRAER